MSSRASIASRPLLRSPRGSASLSRSLTQLGHHLGRLELFGEQQLLRHLAECRQRTKRTPTGATDAVRGEPECALSSSHLYSCSGVGRWSSERDGVCSEQSVLREQHGLRAQESKQLAQRGVEASHTPQRDGGLARRATLQPGVVPILPFGEDEPLRARPRRRRRAADAGSDRDVRLRLEVGGDAS